MDSRNAPRVTVLMTLYNKGKFVLEAIESVLAGTYTDLEVLVVDDASTDNGPSIVRSIKDERVRLIESDVNTGRADAANRGYDKATGAYVAVMDADDIMHPQRLEQQVAFLDAHPEVVVCGSWISAFGNSGSVVKVPAADEEARARSMFGMPVLYPTAMFRRSVLERHRLRCPSGWRTPGMDLLFMLEVGKYGKYGNIQTSLMNYRVGEQNMRYGRDPIKDNLILFSRVLSMMNIDGDADEVRTHLYFIGLFSTRMTWSDVVAMRAWKRKLLTRAVSANVASRDALQAQLDKRWDQLFYQLTEHGVLAGSYHWALSENRSFAKLKHLVRRALMPPRSKGTSDRIDR
jgi:glycosyltransferase involved in cell wall biosynthesis